MAGWGSCSSSFAKLDREFAGGVDVAEEDVCERLGSADAGVPHLDDAFDVVDPGHADGAAGFEHDDGVGVGGGDGFDEGVLVAGQGERCCVHVFTQWLVGKDDGDGGGLCELSGCGDIVAAGVFDGGLGRLRLDIFQRRRREVDGFAPFGAAGLRIRGIAAGGVDLRGAAAGENAYVGV